MSKLVITSVFKHGCDDQKAVYRMLEGGGGGEESSSLPCSHQANNIRMRSHPLLYLDSKKSAASCHQACCKLIVWTLLSTSLMQVVSAASPQITSCIRARLSRPVFSKVLNFFT